MAKPKYFKLGAKVRDAVTGFVGIATSRVEFLNGCVRYCVTPKVDKDGKTQDEKYFDCEQMELVEEESVKIKSRSTGGGDNPPNRDSISG